MSFQTYLGYKKITSTVSYTKTNPERFREMAWRQLVLSGANDRREIAIFAQKFCCEAIKTSQQTTNGVTIELLH